MHICRPINCLVLLGCCTFLLATPTSAKEPPHDDFIVYETYLNDSYYKDFPLNTVNFRPRMQKNLRDFEELDAIIDEMDVNYDEEGASGPKDESFTAGLKPSKTNPQKLVPRSTFTFSCPTAIQCSDAGCCPIGSWCAIIEGQIGCCDLPIGKSCLAFPNANCNLPCGDICCDSWNGPDPNGLLSGNVVCDPVPGVDLNTDWDDHTPAYRCQFEGGPSSATTAPCPSNSPRCGGECCPTGFICNTDIPGIAFCDPSNDPNLSASVTAVSQLGFNAQSFNASIGAHPTNLTSGSVYTATTAIMEGTAATVPSSSLYKSFSGSSTSNTATSTATSATASVAGAMAQAQQTDHGLIVGAVVAFAGLALALGL
jgi:hypothetical protein